jgi:hypothetical protein
VEPEAKTKAANYIGNRPAMPIGRSSPLGIEQPLRLTAVVVRYREFTMKSLPIVAIAVLGAVAACSVNHETVQRPMSAPAPAAATIAPDSVSPTATSAVTTNPGAPGPIVLNNSDPPMRVR